MNTTYTYIQTHKSLYENQALSCASSSRGAENHTPNMWLEGRGISPSNPHVPYSAITALNWSLVTASQQHHSSFNTAGERHGGWAILETRAVCWQNRYEMGRNNPSFSPSASTLLFIKAGWPCPWKIIRRFVLSSWLRYCANDDLGTSPQENIKFVVIFHFQHQLPDQPAEADNFQLLLIEEGVRRSDQGAKTSVSLISYASLSLSRF